MATEVLIKGVPSRNLPQAQADNQREGIPPRFDRYGGLYGQPMVRKAHALADEGSYFTVHNSQTGVITPANTGFTATAPAMLIANVDVPSNPLAKNIYLDYVDLLITAAGVTATAVQGKMMALLLDSVNIYTSGGTNLATGSNINVNMTSSVKSIANIYFGNITASGGGGTSRLIVGQRLMRLPVSATTAPDLINDVFHFNFGGVENATSYVSGSTGALQANVVQSTLNLPPVVIGPGQSLLFYIWQLVAGGTFPTGTTYSPEIGWWER
jgi:hypothetical protein